MTKLPEVIWLQVYGDADKSEGLPPDGTEVTWSMEKVFDSDIKYVLDKRHAPKKRVLK